MSIRVVSASILFLAAIVGGWAWYGSTIPSQPRPFLAFLPASQQVDGLIEGEEDVFDLYLQNKGHANQSVKLIGSCGCTKLSVNGVAVNGPIDVPAVKQVAIQATLSTAGIFGEKRLMVLAVDPRDENRVFARAEVSAYIAAQLRADTLSVVLNDRTTEKKVLLYDGLDDPPKIEAVECDLAHVDCRLNHSVPAGQTVWVNRMKMNPRAILTLNLQTGAIRKSTSTGTVTIRHQGRSSPLTIQLAVEPTVTLLSAMPERVKLQGKSTNQWAGSVLLTGQSATAADLTVDAPRGLTVEFKGTGGRNQIATISCDAWPESLGEQTEVVFHAPQSGARVAVVVERSRETVGVQPR